MFKKTYNRKKNYNKTKKNIDLLLCISCGETPA